MHDYFVLGRRDLLLSQSVPRQFSLPMIELLQAVIAQSPPSKLPAKDAIAALLTFGRRVPLELRIPSLAPFDGCVFEAVSRSQTVKITSDPATAAGVENLRVYFNVLGRLHLRPLADDVVDYGLDEVVEVGHLALSPQIVAQARAHARTIRAEEMQLRALLDRVLCEAEHDGSLKGLLDEIDDSVRHVEAVCFYADDRLYAVMERVTNLVATRKGPGLIDLLRRAPVAQWRSSDRLAMVALRALFLSGASVRFEEFNSIELTAKRLFECLHRLGSSYSTALQIPFEPPVHPFDLGRAIGALAERARTRSWVRYRRVSGITFQKQEHCIQLAADSASDRILQASFRALRCKWPCEAPDLARAFFTTIAQDAIEATCFDSERKPAGPAPHAGAASALERLIEDIVVSAVRATGADYGMSSSLRRPGALFVDKAEDLGAAIGALTPKHFYCCIVGTDELRRRFGERLNGDVFRAVQARMQFNRWHFIAGNLPRHLVADDRHYFYPPVLPDLAEWVDQFHAGHIRAAVRYSARSPGPEIVDTPLEISGHEFRGFYDVRVVRVGEKPFDLRDLAILRTHSLWMGHVWRTILANCLDPIVRAQLHIAGFANGHGAVLTTAEIAAAV